MDTRQLRTDLARWVTGVAVITCLDRTGTPLGKTANSFHTVSLDPPLVAWCVDRASSRYDEWLAAPGYAVHVLSDQQADLVPRFAASATDKFAGLQWETGPFGIPLLAQAHLRIITQVHDRYPVGDHTYLIGAVLEIQTCDTSAPLFFHRGTVMPLCQSTPT